ncbi:MAG: efflux RND transporter periplasmic adaptor subunit [Melioribacteraceae bacterium]|nr:efflux RND transporter periplasmic adaptor subunit [Melioribacteraceae bacterium]
MKKWKVILLAAVMLIIVAAILFINKKKMSAESVGGIKDVYYVKVEKAARKNLPESLSLVGTVTANNDVNVISETSGKVLAVFAKVGDFKQAGSILFQVDDELKKAALMSAEANYEKSKKDFERFEQLYKERSASDAQFDQIKLSLSIAEAQYIVAKRQFNDTQIKTPISGYITARYADVGSTLQGSPQPTVVANIVDISRLKVKLNVAEADAFTLKTNDPVSVTVDVYPEKVFKGKIESIGSKGDEAHTYPIEIIIVNERDNPLKAGMFARVEFNSINDRNSIVISRESLIGSIKQPQVFVVENGMAKLRNITVGKESGTFVEVLQGLMVGEEVVVNGQNNIVENTQVTVIK